VKNERVRKVTLERIEEKKTCPVCGKEFWGLKKAKFDSRECRDKDYYARHIDEIRARQSAVYEKRKKLAEKK
jgi:ribosomal protein L33